MIPTWSVLKQLLVCLSVIAVTHIGPVFATQTDTPPSDREGYEKAYQEGRYDAVLTYLSAQKETRPLQQGTVYYNMGNVYYKQGDYAKAYWAYQKAKRALPRDADVHHNVSLTQKKLGLDVTPDTGLMTYLRLFPFFSYTEHLIGLWFMVTFLGLFSWVVYKYPTLKYRRMVWGVLGIGICWFSFGATYRYLTQTHTKTGIVIHARAALKAGPVASLPTLTTLPAGTAIECLRTQNGWTEIQVDGGLIGWVSETDYWTL